MQGLPWIWLLLNANDCLNLRTGPWTVISSASQDSPSECRKHTIGGPLDSLTGSVHPFLDAVLIARWTSLPSSLENCQKVTAQLRPQAQGHPKVNDLLRDG